MISAHRGENVGPFRPIGFAKNTDCPRVLYTCGDPLGYRRRGAVYRIPRTAFQLLSAVPRTAWGCHGLAAALGAGDRSLAGDWGGGGAFFSFAFSTFPLLFDISTFSRLHVSHFPYFLHIPHFLHFLHKIPQKMVVGVRFSQF